MVTKVKTVSTHERENETKRKRTKKRKGASASPAGTANHISQENSEVSGNDRLGQAETDVA